MPKTYTRDEITGYITREFGTYAREATPKVNVWLARGDGIAVYVDHDLSHPQMGTTKMYSYGSPAAQLETDDPPVRLPDIGGAINWRYQLEGTYRGDVLTVPDVLPGDDEEEEEFIPEDDDEDDDYNPEDYPHDEDVSLDPPWWEYR